MAVWPFGTDDGKLMDSGLPNPKDRSQAWMADRPAYQVWCDDMKTKALDRQSRLSVVESNRLIHHYGENALDRSSLERIAEMGPLVELGAGNGYAAGLLADLGADIVATDPEASRSRISDPPWFPVEPGSYVSTVRGSRLPLLVWPYMTPPAQWLQSEGAPDKLVVVNDVAPDNLGTRSAGSYHDLLSRGWTITSSFQVSTGWRSSQDYVHIWAR
jgi:hypothetical protein